MGKELEMDEPMVLVQTKGQQPHMGTTPSSGRDGIKVITGITASAFLQVPPDGGPLTNDFFEKTGGGLIVL